MDYSTRHVVGPATFQRFEKHLPPSRHALFAVCKGVTVRVLFQVISKAREVAGSEDILQSLIEKLGVGEVLEAEPVKVDLGIEGCVPSPGVELLIVVKHMAEMPQTEAVQQPN